MKVGVLLAAGASSRMGSPKALVMHKGQSFLAHGVRHLWAACDIVVVVLGSRAAAIRKAAEVEFSALVEQGELAKDLHAARRHGAKGLELRFETNEDWASGMYSSARVGLAAALKLRPEAVLLLPVDHPQVSSQTVTDLAELMAAAIKAFGGRGRTASDFAYALVPRHRRRRGHPVAMTPALARAIVRDRESTDLNDAIRGHARLIGYADVRDPGVVVNRNTPEAEPARARRARRAKATPKRTARR